MANLSQAYRNPDGIVRAARQYCGFCERFGCMIGAKAQPTNTLLPVIERQKGVTVRTGANVRRVLYQGGSATGICYVDSCASTCCDVNTIWRPGRQVSIAKVADF